MFENDGYETPTRPWAQLITQKRETFKEQIRSRHIESYKGSIRQKFNLIINYADPSASAARIKSAIAKQQYQIKYIINVVSGLMENYHLCTQLARQKVIETVLVQLHESTTTPQLENEGRNNNEQQGLMQWVQLVGETTKYYPELWRPMYEESISIFWAILCQSPNNYQMCFSIQKLFKVCSGRFNIETSPNDQDLLYLLSQPSVSPCVLRSIGESMTIKMEQTLHNYNMIEKCSFYLGESDEHCGAYISLISSVGFVSRSVLELLQKKLRSGRIQDKKLCVKILYEQMYFSEEQMEELERSNHECGLFVRAICENDD